jgi:hypothetical protein
MTLQETVFQGLIRFFFHPFPRNRSIDFKTQLKKTNRVLISCPPGKEHVSFSKAITDIVSLFPKEGLVVLTPDREGIKTHPSPNNAIHSMYISEKNPWNIIRSPALKQLAQHRFDVLLDMDPEFSLLNIYLCRLLRPPVRICFPKPYSEHYYNLQYNGKPNTPYPQKIEGLFQFLQSLLS